MTVGSFVLQMSYATPLHYCRCLCLACTRLLREHAAAAGGCGTALCPLCRTPIQSFILQVYSA